jgi:ATP-binding cassette subfamily F protein 3
MAVWQKKHAECIEALERAEGLWMDALEKLEQAEAQ